MNTDLSALNELDCYYLWAQSQTGYADPNANKLGHLQVIIKSIDPSIVNVSDMNALACLRAIVASASPTLQLSAMNELACLRMIYDEGYAGDADENPARWNSLACLRGIVKNL